MCLQDDCPLHQVLGMERRSDSYSLNLFSPKNILYRTDYPALKNTLLHL